MAVDVRALTNKIVTEAKRRKIHYREKAGPGMYWVWYIEDETIGRVIDGHEVWKVVPIAAAWPSKAEIGELIEMQAGYQGLLADRTE